jgi:hypothetical protein
MNQGVRAMTISQLQMAVGIDAAAKLQIFRSKMDEQGGHLAAEGIIINSAVTVVRQTKRLSGSGYLLQLSCGHAVPISDDDGMSFEGAETTCPRSHN